MVFSYSRKPKYLIKQYHFKHLFHLDLGAIVIVEMKNGQISSEYMKILFTQHSCSDNICAKASLVALFLCCNYSMR